MTSKDKCKKSSCSDKIPLGMDIDLKILKSNKFTNACEEVSRNAYLDYPKRLNLIFIPNCIDDSYCKHKDYESRENKKIIMEMPPRAENSFNMAIKSNLWFDALETSLICISSRQYLTADVLKHIVEIMLNAHEDISSKISITQLLNKCKQVLALHFLMHTPCHNHNKITKVYTEFLMKPMYDPVSNEKSSNRSKSFSRRNNFQYEKGIVKYCFNRLEEEVFNIQDDGPLVIKEDEIPESMKQSTKGLHFEKEHLEIYESLERTDRINRLMMVLHSIIELLQFDLIIIKFKSKCLMSLLLWPEGIKNKTQHKITEITKQIIKLFIYFIHLGYPEQHIKTMGLWLNIVIETLYHAEIDNYYDYPIIKVFVKEFAKVFYNTMSELSYETMTKVLEKIEPSYMKYNIGLTYIQLLINSREENIIQIIIDFLKNEQWKDFEISETIITKKLNEVKEDPYNIIEILSQTCKSASASIKNNNNKTYPKFIKEKFDNAINLNIVTNAMYMTLVAYIDSFSIKNLKKTLEKKNNGDSEKTKSTVVTAVYQTTPRIANTCRTIYYSLNEIILILNEMKNENGLPEHIKVFENIFKLGVI